MTYGRRAQAPRGTRRRLRQAASALAAAAVGLTLLSGCAGRQEPTEPPPLTPSSPTQKPPQRPGAEDFAPYVDTSLNPSYDLMESAEATGTKEFNLAFVSPAGRACTPAWGGKQRLTENSVANQVARLRDEGGDVRISFGGQSGKELARVCRSLDELVKAYTKVVDTFELTKLDFDLEGPALTDRRANGLRNQALARLQKQDPDLNISFTLPVMPSGLSPDSLAVLQNARQSGVRVSRVNIMAMDYGTSFTGDMGTYAMKAATVAQRQIRPALGLRDEKEAWSALVVTPMIGVNDVKGEVFKPQDARELRKFAAEKKLAGLSMWSGTRDQPCPDGPNTTAQAACSGISAGEDAFAEAFLG
jgi:hypothetical protein